MIIFLVLIAILIILFASIGYLNYNGNMKRTDKSDYSGDNSASENFSVNSNYYSLINTWQEMKLNSAGEGEMCYNTDMCSNGLTCYSNPATKQNACYSKPTNGFSQTIGTGTIIDYSVPKLYTTLCSQRKKNGSYETYYPDINNILLEDTTEEKVCEEVLYQKIITTQNSNKCYDVDQLHGTKVVELCTAERNTNNVCINDNGDRVFSPDFNTVKIKQDLTICEDNTSINYISLNYNNSPQTDIEFKTNNNDDYSFAGNQLFCLETNSVGYYTNIQIDKDDDGFYLSFEGTWGFVYKIKIDVSNIMTEFQPSPGNIKNLNFKTDLSYNLPTLTNNLSYDYTVYAITYKFPKIKNLTSDSFDIYKSDGTTLIKKFSTGVMINVSELDDEFLPDPVIGLAPCAPFDPSYLTPPKPNKWTNINEIGYDKQKFKVSRFALDSKGNLTPDQNGLISSIVYRQLNYSNGGLYLDYKVGKNNEGLTLKPSGADKYNESKKWLLLKPLETSPYTIPSSSDAWCNYSFDISSDGGKNFNGKTGISTPMTSVSVTQGQDMIDPLYRQIAKQPNEKLFNILGNIATIAGEIGAIALTGGAASAIGGLSGFSAGVATSIETGIKLVNLVHGSTDFSWLNSDPSFAGCAQICENSLKFNNIFNSYIPKVKAVALNSGTLGSSPPGHILSATQDFDKGDVLFGFNIHLVNTCAYYKLYTPSVNAPHKPIFNRNIGDTFTDGEVDFVIKDIFENTYYFDESYFNLSGDIVADKITVLPQKSNYGKIQPKKNVITNIYQKTTQFFSRTVFTSSDEPPLVACTCSDSDYNMIIPGCDIGLNKDDGCSGYLENVVMNFGRYHPTDIDSYNKIFAALDVIDAAIDDTTITKAITAFKSVDITLESILHLVITLGGYVTANTSTSVGISVIIISIISMAIPIVEYKIRKLLSDIISASNTVVTAFTISNASGSTSSDSIIFNAALCVINYSMVAISVAIVVNVIDNNITGNAANDAYKAANDANTAAGKAATAADNAAIAADKAYKLDQGNDIKHKFKDATKGFYDISRAASTAATAAASAATSGTALKDLNGGTYGKTFGFIDFVNTMSSNSILETSNIVNSSTNTAITNAINNAIDGAKDVITTASNFSDNSVIVAVANSVVLNGNVIHSKNPKNNSTFLSKSLIANNLLAINKYNYNLTDVSSDLDIQLIFNHHYSTTHSNKQYVEFSSGKINFNSDIDENTNKIKITQETYDKLGAEDSSVTTSNILFDKTKKYIDIKGKELVVDLDYADFSVTYMLYDKTNPIAVVSPTILTDGTIDKNKPLNITQIDYDAYAKSVVNSNGNPVFTIEEIHSIPYTINTITIIVEHMINIQNKTTVTLKTSPSVWKIDERAPRNLLGKKTNAMLFFSSELPISLIKDDKLKHGPSPQQMAYLGSFEQEDENCSSYTEEECNTQLNCRYREYDSGNICMGKTLLEKFQDENLTLDISQNLTGDLFNIKTDGTNKTSITFLKTLQIEKLNYKAYITTLDEVKGSGGFMYSQRKQFDYYEEQEYSNLGQEKSEDIKPVLGRFIPYSYVYPTGRGTDGNERSILGVSGDININNFYNNLNYTQFIPYGKKSDYQYGFVNDSDIPTF